MDSSSIDTLPNTHLIYALGELPDKTFVLIVGVTDDGIALLIDEKKTLLVHPPGVVITEVIIFHERDKAALKAKFRETGLPLRELENL